MTSAASMRCSSCNCDEVDSDGAELSERACSVEFNTSATQYDTTCSSSPTSSVVPVSVISQAALDYRGMREPVDGYVDQTTSQYSDDSLPGANSTKGLNAAVQRRHRHIRVSCNGSLDSNSTSMKHIKSSPSVSGNNCSCFQLMLLRCKGDTGRWSELSNSSANSQGTMQTFSFADSKLGYLTAAKGALVVRVRSFRAATPHHGTTMTSQKALVAAAGGGGWGARACDDVKTGCLADETGNFTLVQRRLSAMNKLQSSVPSRAAEAAGPHQLKDAESGSSGSSLSLARDGGVSQACSSGGVVLVALSMWQRLVVGLETLVGLQSASHRSYNFVN